MSAFPLLVFMVKSSVLEIKVGQPPRQSPLKCLIQSNIDPFKPMQKGSASIKVTSDYYYDSFARKTVCCVLDINVEITGATPGDYFEVFANYIIYYSAGSGGYADIWERLGSGVVDANGNLLITTGVGNPTEDYSVEVWIAIADSSCENVYIAKLQQLCARKGC